MGLLESLYVEGGSALGNQVMSQVSLILSIILIIFLIYCVFKLFEKSKPTTEYIVLLAILTAITVIGNLFGMAIPGLQIGTFVLIMAGVVFGKETGLILGFITAIVWDLITGIGFWLPYQMLAFGIIGFLSGLISNKMDNIIVRIVFGFLMGILFGWITNLTMFFFLSEINLNTIIGVYVLSLSFDVIRGVCNAILLAIGYNWFVKILNRSKDKFNLN